MIKVLLVDDEVLAMEYLHNMIDWEGNGYQIVGHAFNGRKAMEMYEEERPDIVISDIKMVGMDGLELAEWLKQRNPDVIVILLSAYKDFEYAQKGIEYGVANYLLKHELNEKKLIQELEKVRKKLETGAKTRKIYQKYFTRQLIYNQADTAEIEAEELGNRFFLVMIHRNDKFQNGKFKEIEWTAEEIMELAEVLEEDKDGISYVADVRLTINTVIILYQIENITSKYMVSTMIERKSKEIEDRMKRIPGCQFNLIYSDEIRKNEISNIFQRMSRQIHHAVFWKPCRAYPLNRLRVSEDENKVAWNELMKELSTMIYDGNQEWDHFIAYLFEKVKYPEYNLGEFKELLHALENLIRELEEKEGFMHKSMEEEGNRIEDIQNYYVSCIRHIYFELQERKNKKYSRLIQDVMRYIRKNYNQELSLEILGERFQMNGVYLGQMFKKEVGVTFLKFLTNCRVEEAKRLLEEGDLNISEVAEKVGYKTSQYFSQIFIKTTGVRPQEYKKWNEAK